jgi:hypothetical protein
MGETDFIVHVSNSGLQSCVLDATRFHIMFHTTTGQARPFTPFADPSDSGHPITPVPPAGPGPAHDFAFLVRQRTECSDSPTATLETATAIAFDDTNGTSIDVALDGSTLSSCPLTITQVSERFPATPTPAAELTGELSPVTLSAAGGSTLAYTVTLHNNGSSVQLAPCPTFEQLLTEGGVVTVQQAAALDCAAGPLRGNTSRTYRFELKLPAARSPGAPAKLTWRLSTPNGLTLGATITVT